MTIEISNVEPWAAPFPLIMATIIIGFVFLVGFGILGIVKDWAVGPALILLGLMAGMIGIPATLGSQQTDHENRVHAAKVSAIESLGFADVSLEGTQFTASKGDKFIRGALFDRGNEKYELLTEGTGK